MTYIWVNDEIIHDTQIKHGQSKMESVPSICEMFKSSWDDILGLNLHLKSSKFKE